MYLSGNRSTLLRKGGSVVHHPSADIEGTITLHALAKTGAGNSSSVYFIHPSSSVLHNSPIHVQIFM